MVDNLLLAIPYFPSFNRAWCQCQAHSILLDILETPREAPGG